MDRFKELTIQGGVVIMGHSTWNSLPKRYRPLSERVNIVMSRDKNLAIPGAIVVNSMNEAIQAVPEEATEVWVMGGAKIYELFLEVFADELYVTRFNADGNADTFFPEFEKLFVQKVSEKHTHKNEDGTKLEYTFETWVRPYKIAA